MSSFWGQGGDWGSEPDPKPCCFPPAGWCSWLRMSLSHPQGGFLPWSQGSFLTTNPLILQNYSGLTQNLEVSCQRERGMRVPEAPSQPITFLIMALTPTGSTSICCWSGRAPGRGALVQSLPQKSIPPFLALIDIGFVPDHKENEWNLWASSLRARFIGRKGILWSFFMYLLLRSKWASYFQSETLLLLTFSHMSSGTWSHSRIKPSLGLSANHCLCGKLSAPWIPWVRAGSCICTGVHRSGTSNRESWSSSQPLQPVLNHFIKNTIWKISFVKQEIKLRQIMHLLDKCHQFKSSYSLHPLQCFPWL